MSQLSPNMPRYPFGSNIADFSNNAIGDLFGRPNLTSELARDAQMEIVEGKGKETAAAKSTQTNGPTEADLRILGQNEKLLAKLTQRDATITDAVHQIQKLRAQLAARPTKEEWETMESQLNTQKFVTKEA